MKFAQSLLRALVTLVFPLLTLTLALAAPAAFAEPPQRLIVKYKDSVPLSARLRGADRAVLQAPAGRAGVLAARLRAAFNGADVVRLSGRHLGDGELRAMMAEIAADPRVEYVEEDRLLKPLFTPDDPRYHEQWAYYESAGGIDLPLAWDSATGTGIVVAVIDTGYRPHADLAANIVGGYDFISDTFVSNDGDGRDGDATDPGDANEPNECYRRDPGSTSSWHGTHVAGTIAAVTNNGVGVAGVAFGAKVLPLRVLGKCGGYTSDIADAIVWASGGHVEGVPDNSHIARVINMSLGGSGKCDALSQSAINTARANGTVVAVAAGNENTDARKSSPANCTGVITVAAVNRSGGKAYYSNTGSVVDVAAPGGAQNSETDPNGILSTLNDGLVTPGGDSYAFYQGTSMATPHVAAVAALVLSKNPSLTPDEVETLLRTTVRAFPAACNRCGAGIVDAAAAVAAASDEGGGDEGGGDEGGGDEGGGDGGGGDGGDGDGVVCAAGYQQYDGELARKGVDYIPDSEGYNADAGTHLGELGGSEISSFDLTLEQLDRGRWRSVAKARNQSGSISYEGAAGTYRFHVTARQDGAYTLCVKTP